LDAIIVESLRGEIKIYKLEYITNLHKKKQHPTINKIILDI